MHAYTHVRNVTLQLARVCSRARTARELARGIPRAEERSNSPSRPVHCPPPGARRHPGRSVSVRHWWVNHKQTFRHEFEGGFIWSPKRKRDGSRNRYYDFLIRSLKRMGVDPDSPPRPQPFIGDQRHSLAFHRREVFLGDR